MTSQVIDVSSTVCIPSCMYDVNLCHTIVWLAAVPYSSNGNRGGSCFDLVLFKEGGRSEEGEEMRGN